MAEEAGDDVGFWGIELKPNKPVSYSPEPGLMLKVSGAALRDPKESKDSKEAATVVVVVGEQHFCLCTLRPGSVDQYGLDIYFTGDKDVTFLAKGKLTVHLTGYLSPYYMGDRPGFSDDEYDSDEGSLSPTSPLIEEIGSSEEEGEDIEHTDNESDDDEEGDELSDSFIANDSESSEEDQKQPAGKKRKPEAAQPAAQGKKQKVTANGGAASPAQAPAAKKGQQQPQQQQQQSKQKQPKQPKPEQAQPKAQAAQGQSQPQAQAQSKKAEQAPKPFACPGCTKSFVSENALTQHKTSTGHQ